MSNWRTLETALQHALIDPETRLRRETAFPIKVTMLNGNVFEGDVSSLTSISTDRHTLVLWIGPKRLAFLPCAEIGSITVESD